MEIITSRHNPIIKEIRELKKRAARDKLGLAFVEGRRLVQEALGVSGVEIKTLCVSESFAGGAGLEEFEKAAASGKTRLIILPDDVYGTVSDTKQPQGILAVVRMHEYALRDLTMNRRSPGRLLILDRVSDPGNVGAMMRTAAAAGFSGVILSEGCADIYSPKVMRATMGAIFRIPFMRDADLASAFEELKSFDYKIYASHAATTDNDSQDCFKASLCDGNAALVIGSEALGIDPLLTGQCDGALSIPMPGGAESLNAGVAAGILMYEFVRRDLIRAGALE